MLKAENLVLNVEDNGSKKCLLDHISFQVDDGEMLVITGPNGGGKSTLAKVLIGIEKAESGKIFLNGEDITDFDINHRANAGIGYAFQQPPRFKGMTVQRLLALAAGRELEDQECCRLLSDVGLCAEEYLGRQIDGTLSGGEMKRIEIAMVLARGTKLSVFDEPEAGIDLWSFARLTETFEQIHSQGSATMIIISHQERIISLADEVIVVGDGTLRHRGTPKEILPRILTDTLGGCPVLNKEVHAL